MSLRSRKFKQGQEVWFRGKYAIGYSVKGVVEAVDSYRDPNSGIYGIRLINGNFHWAAEDQLKTLEDLNFRALR